MTVGNSKLGQSVLTFSLPAGITCPGQTEVCSKCCYAMGGHFLQRAIQEKYRQQLEFTKSKEFVPEMRKILASSKIPVLRIHVSGDFYDAAYTHKWTAILASLPDIRAYAYTRSWRISRMMPALLKLASLPNMRLWLSADRDTGMPVGIALPVAYLQLSDDEPVPKGCGLVFRTHRNTVLTRANNAKVCPVESGLPFKIKPTCGSCKFCFPQ